MSLLKKEVKEFPSQAEAEKFVKDTYKEKPPTGFDPEKGFMRWNPNTQHVTWGKIPNYSYSKATLTDEEKKLQEDLDKSITPEVIEEWGKNEMLRHVRGDYWSHPNARGMKDKR
jgi:hypothetical protein